jgi:hypothetical protein
MKTNTEPTAIEKLKVEIEKVAYRTQSAIEDYGVWVDMRLGDLIGLINQALSEAERKIFEDCLLKFWSVLPDDPQMIELLKRYQSKHGAKI